MNYIIDFFTPTHLTQDNLVELQGEELQIIYDKNVKLITPSVTYTLQNETQHDQAIYTFKLLYGVHHVYKTNTLWGLWSAREDRYDLHSQDGKTFILRGLLKAGHVKI